MNELADIVEAMPAERQIRLQIELAVLGSGLTNGEFAKRAGISAKHLSEVLNGHSGVTLDTAERLLRVVGRRLVITSRDAW